jgi:hypothetical protein
MALAFSVRLVSIWAGYLALVEILVGVIAGNFLGIHATTGRSRAAGCRITSADGFTVISISPGLFQDAPCSCASIAPCFWTVSGSRCGRSQYRQHWI